MFYSDEFDLARQCNQEGNLIHEEYIGYQGDRLLKMLEIPRYLYLLSNNSFWLLPHCFPLTRGRCGPKISFALESALGVMSQFITDWLHTTRVKSRSEMLPVQPLAL